MFLKMNGYEFLRGNHLFNFRQEVPKLNQQKAKCSLTARLRIFMKSIA